MKVLVVAEQPIKSGVHHQILDSIFKYFKVQYDIVSVFPQMADKDLKKVKPEQWLAQSDGILTTAQKYDKILCLGTLASATVFESPKSVPTAKVRGRGFMSPTNQYTIVSIPPKTCIADADFYRDLVFDVEKLVTNNKVMEQPENEILLIETVKDLSLLSDLHGASWCSCDLETTSLNPFSLNPDIPHIDSKILGLGFCVLTDKGEGYTLVVPEKIIDTESGGKKIFKFLTQYDGEMVFHNAKFDMKWLWHRFGRFMFRNLSDTMLMQWELDERPFGRYKHLGLDRLQRLHFDAPPKSVSMREWLQEYYRIEVGDKERQKWMLAECEKSPEKVRNAWRKWHLDTHGEEADWRGRKVLRDIPLEDLEEALVATLLPKNLRPAPTEERKTQMWDEMMTYMGEDCFSTARLFPLLKEKMDEESPRLWRTHKYFDIPASYALARVEYQGTRVDLPYLRKMKKEIEAILEEEIVELRAAVQKLTAHPKGAEFNPNSSLQVKEVLYDKEKGLGLTMPKGVGRFAYMRADDEVTTNSDTLKVLARTVMKDRPAVSKLISQILGFRIKSKIIGTYVDGILSRVDSDGRIRGDFIIPGTATARISCQNPNLQNIPDASHVGYDIRKAYIPSQGWTLLEADYSQLELRVAGLFSQDHVLIDAYKNGADIHQEVAFMLWNKPKDQITKYERYLAKCMNFGVIYGRGARSIATGPEMDNLVEMSGRSWGNNEIDAYFAKFKEGYKDLFDWMELVKRDSVEKQFVENPTGHRRRFDLILPSERSRVERQSVNAPIQGFAARMTIHALAELDRVFDPEKQRILFTVHDSILCECVNKAKIVKETKELIIEVMQTHLPEAFMTLPCLAHSPLTEGDRLEYNLPFVADVAVGKNWGDCH